MLEARVRIELTIEVLQTSALPLGYRAQSHANKKPSRAAGLRKLERETGFEPATSTLARSHSTAELLPLRRFGHYIERTSQRQCYPCARKRLGIRESSSSPSSSLLVVLLRGHRELGGLGFRRTRPHKDVEYAWLDDSPHFFIPERQAFRREVESDRRLFAGCEVNSLEASQLKDGARDGTDALMDVELRHLIPFASSRVRDIHGHFGTGIGGDLRGFDAQIFKFETCVTQSVAERE